MTNDTNAFAAANHALDDAFANPDAMKSWEAVAITLSGHLPAIRRALQQAADPNLVTVPREPTEAMLDAVTRGKAYQKQMWRAMVNAALKEPPEGLPAAPTDQK